MDSATHSSVVRLGTRGSLLARAQSQLVATDLESHHPGLRVELIIVKTTGDAITDRPLHEFGGKGLFTKELEQALLAGTVDFVVHSYKDVPVTMPLVEQADLIIACTPVRQDPRDVLACRNGVIALRDLPKGARVGTGSLRRKCQIASLRPDIVIEPIRGNIDTRLRKLKEGQYDAVVLAAAGLRRAGLYDPSCMCVMNELLPAPGQGALALQCRRQDEPVRDLLSDLHDTGTEICVTLERRIVLGLNGDCNSPIAAYAALDDENVGLKARIGGRGGEPPLIEASADGPRKTPEVVATEVLRKLKALGAMAMLSGDRM